jgi:hypothetical protein
MSSELKHNVTMSVATENGTGVQFPLVILAQQRVELGIILEGTIEGNHRGTIHVQTNGGLPVIEYDEERVAELVAVFADDVALLMLPAPLDSSWFTLADPGRLDMSTSTQDISIGIEIEIGVELRVESPVSDVNWVLMPQQISTSVSTNSGAEGATARDSLQIYNLDSRALHWQWSPCLQSLTEAATSAPIKPTRLKRQEVSCNAGSIVPPMVKDAVGVHHHFTCRASLSCGRW